ncbi:MAG: hypothetical protein IJM57_08235 [Lachnospiraceae bacterium]|nr:hypothetical protein [Lachnospiraceae bacterium]
MKRRNPATASSPNPQFEMTSFMDIIFIFLFVVMIGYALKCADQTDAAKNEMAEADQKLAEASRMLAEAEGARADIQIYEQQISELKGSVIGRRVLIISISCRYDAGDINHPEEWQRHLRVLGTDRQMMLERDFQDGSVKSTYDKLREVLTEYVESVKKTDPKSGDPADANKQDRTVIIFSIDREDGGILTNDYEAIMGIVEELENAYDDVY